MDIYKKVTGENVKRYLSRFLRVREDAEDLAQEAFLKVLEAGAKGEIHCSEAYLYRTARNLALNRLAAKSTTAVDSIEDLLNPDVFIHGSPLDDQVAAQQRFEQFCRVVSGLPDQCREVLILRKVYGYSQREVADALGITVSTVEKHVAKGLRRCREQMVSPERRGRKRDSAIGSQV